MTEVIPIYITYMAICKIYYKDISDLCVKKSTPGGQTGVPAVPDDKITLYINAFSQYLWCPCGVPVVSLETPL